MSFFRLILMVILAASSIYIYTRLTYDGERNEDRDLHGVTYAKFLQNDPRLQKQPLPQKIAVVGAGIGGISSAYFLRQHFGNKVEIDLFESNDRLCGRVATTSIAGRSYESGGSIMHDKNLYAKSFANAFDLMKAASLKSGNLGIFDGKKYELRASNWSIVALLQMIWLFGFDVFRLQSVEDEFMTEFMSVYDMQEKGLSFESAKDLFLAIGGKKFVDAVKMNACDLFAQRGIGNSMIKTLINGGLRSNYGQTCSVNGFVGLVSMAGIQPNLWSIDGGNKLLCEKLFANSTLNLIREKVSKVAEKENGQFSIMTGSKVERLYDIVVIATPINQDTSHIDLSNACSTGIFCPSAIEDKRHFRRTVATFVKGKLNSNLFQCDSISTCPGVILTSNELFYRSVGFHAPVDFNPRDGDSSDDGVYKVFSSEVLTQEQLQQLFESWNETKVVDWFAYPYYRPPDRLDAFVLNKKGLYYTSPMEWGASAIEMSIISAKNVALSAYNSWFDISENINARQSEFSSQRSEL